MGKRTLNSSQYDYQAGKSTDHALHYLVCKIGNFAPKKTRGNHCRERNLPSDPPKNAQDVYNQLNDFSRQEVDFRCYVSDMVFIIRGKYEEMISNILQKFLNTINKTVIVTFTKRRNLDKLRQPTLAGETISFAEDVKHLIIILDKKLTCHKGI